MERERFFVENRSVQKRVCAVRVSTQREELQIAAQVTRYNLAIGSPNVRHRWSNNRKLLQPCLAAFGSAGNRKQALELALKAGAWEIEQDSFS
jgi:hypothetical protein